MPSEDQHRNKAERNRQFLETIVIADHPDWVVVVAFYVAVHVAERLRAISGHGDSTSHEERLAYIQSEHPEIHTHYHILQNASMLARYQSNADFFSQFQVDEINEKIIQNRLVPIEEYVRTRIQVTSPSP
jgi:hypothetical protein